MHLSQMTMNSEDHEMTEIDKHTDTDKNVNGHIS